MDKYRDIQIDGQIDRIDGQMLYTKTSWIDDGRIDRNIENG